MTEIGNELKQKREENGLSLEETASDLNISPLLLEKLESGDKSSFGDVLELKQLILNYAKYLGLNENSIETEFNEFIFEYTSKIPVKEIEKAMGNNNLKEKKVVSPYTSIKEENNKSKIILVLCVVLILITIIGMVAIKMSDKYNENNVYVLRR